MHSQFAGTRQRLPLSSRYRARWTDTSLGNQVANVGTALVHEARHRLHHTRVDRREGVGLERWLGLHPTQLRTAQLVLRIEEVLGGEHGINRLSFRVFPPSKRQGGDAPIA